MTSNSVKGNAVALFTILIWGTTFISTKLLLTDFEPVEILFFRFTIGFLALFLVYPHRIKGTSLRQELLFAAAGLFGVALCYTLENVALTRTATANVGVIASAAPFFTAILTARLPGYKKPGANFYVGFAAAMVGIFLISFSGGGNVELSPVGDLLALVSSFCWAVYVVLSMKINDFGYNIIQTTRRVFLYGVVFMVPTLFFSGFDLRVERFENPANLFNILFLGLGASALCFVTWNLAVKLLGAVRTSVYIYLIPVITVVTAVIVLGETVTAPSVLGMVLTLAGLFLSQRTSEAIE